MPSTLGAGKKKDILSSETRKTLLDRDQLAAALNEYYENQVRAGIDGKEICERIAQSVIDKIFKKIQTADNRFREKSLVSQGIPCNGLHAEQSIHLDILIQLSLGKSCPVLFKTNHENLNLLPDSSTMWKDCLSKNGFLSADKVCRLLRFYVWKTVKVFNCYIESGAHEKIPNDLRSIVMKDGEEIKLVINNLMIVNLLPAFVLPDSRMDPSRQDCPSTSHVVCKPFINASSRKIKMVWKWSYFVAEKNRIRSFSGPGCQIQLLRILTEIRDSQSGLRMLSYSHLKHVLFHVTHRVSDVKEWASENISERFTDFLESLLSFLQSEYLPHYFMQPPDFDSVNLFEGLDAYCLERIAESVEKILHNPFQSLNFDKRERE